MTQALRILIVEDEVLIAMYLAMELKQAGYEVCKQVATGEEAVIIAQEEAPDVILMDIRLAGEIDGIEAARQIQACSEIPIIFMTGYSNNAVEERARKLNPLAYCAKPIRIYEIQSILDSLQT